MSKKGYTITTMGFIFDETPHKIQKIVDEIDLKPDYIDKGFQYYKASKVHKYLVEQAENNKVGNGGGLDVPTSHKERLEAAKADMEEVKLAKLKGELVEANTVEKAWSRMALAFRAKILSMPRKISGQAIAIRERNELEDFLTESVREALEELSNERIEPDDEQDSGVTETTA